MKIEKAFKIKEKEWKMAKHLLILLVMLGFEIFGFSSCTKQKQQINNESDVLTRKIVCAPDEYQRHIPMGNNIRGLFCFREIPIRLEGKTTFWMDRNLGALKVALHAQDISLETVGFFYQWKNPKPVATMKDIFTGFLYYRQEEEKYNQFYESYYAKPEHWKFASPCPDPYRLPTKSEWEDIQKLANNAGDIFKNLYIIAAGSYDTDRSDTWNETPSFYWSGETEEGKAGFSYSFALNEVEMYPSIQMLPWSSAQVIRCVRN